MKKLLLVLLISATLFSCDKDDDRLEQPGIPTSIKGNVADHYRNFKIDNFKIQLIKFWSCSSGFTPKTCQKIIATVFTDENGNYEINFDHNLREDENYLVICDNSTRYVSEFIDFTETPKILKGQENVLDINAWKPVKIKINLVVLNNHTPPLITGFSCNQGFDLGTNNTYEENAEMFELNARPNCDGSLDFWYIENYTSNNPIWHTKSFPYQTGVVDGKVLNYEINCNEF